MNKPYPDYLKNFIEAGKKNNAKLLKWKRENPELVRKISSETARATHKKYPNLASEMGKSTQLKYPNLSKERAIKTHKKYLGLASRMGKISHAKYPNLVRENAFKSIEIQRKNKSNYWEGVPFASKEEMKVAQLLLDKPKEKSNVHVKIGYSLEVDFFPQKKVFIEYHPDLWGKTKEQYMAPRIKTLHDSVYKDKKIEFIFDSIKTNKFKDRIKEIKEKYNI